MFKYYIVMEKTYYQYIDKMNTPIFTPFENKAHLFDNLFKANIILSVIREYLKNLYIGGDISLSTYLDMLKKTKIKIKVF